VDPRPTRYAAGVVHLNVLSVLIIGCSSGDAVPPSSDPPAKPLWTKRATADCPAYPGRANVALADVDGGYTATITTADAGAVSEIQEHARYVEGASAVNAGAAALKFDRALGDRTANCPVILDGTRVSVTDRAGGVVITVVAKDPANVAALRSNAKEKAEILAAMRKAVPDAMK
jgi:hypothetical protein